MTNMEIEDVLSSIRRLVSEDLRPAIRDSSSRDSAARDSSSRDSATGAPRPAATEGKLVLTPAFRISEPALVKPDETPVWRRAASRYRAESAETDDLVSGDGAVASAADVGDLADEESSDLMAATRDFAAPDDLADPADPSGPHSTEDPLMDLSVPGQDEAAVPPETALIEQQSTLGPDPYADRAFDQGQTTPDTPSDPATLEAAIAELEAAVAASGEEWEPDGSEMTSGDHFILPTIGAGRVMAEAAEAFGLRHSPDEKDLRRLHLEPGTYLDDPAEPVWAEPAGQRQTLERVASGLVDTDQGDASMFASDDTLIDEGMLRELVIEVIRQELQGALGERITRNVRKLVRAEIHRALAGREFE